MDEEAARRKKAEDRYRQEWQKKLEAKFLAENGPRYEKEAAALGVEDKSRRQEIAEETARLYAKRSAQPGQIFFHDDRGLVEEVILRQEAALAEAVRIEQESAKSQRKTAEPDHATDGTTQTVDRLHHQNGRYDVLRKEGIQTPAIVADLHAAAHEVCDPRPRDLPPSNDAGNNPPSNPHNNSPSNGSPSPRNPNQPLSANEVMARLTDSALMQRYQQTEQQREQESKSALTSADPATRQAAQGNSSALQQQPTRNVMDHFVTAEMRRKAGEERQSKINEQNMGQSRGGRGR